MSQKNDPAEVSEDLRQQRAYRRFLGSMNRQMEKKDAQLTRYAEIGLALSGEENPDRLLELIVFEAREITNADAGTLYMISEQGRHLDFVIMQNNSMKTYLGGVSGRKSTLPPVPLYDNGRQNHKHVSAHVAHTGEIVAIPDVYQCDAFDFSGTQKYDQQTGYRSKSMLVIPMRDHENDVIGVLQLLNATDRSSGEPVEFSDTQVSVVASLASQAAATLTKTRLIRNLQELFDAFIKSIAGAIEEKSRYTGGHIARVSVLSLLMAQAVNERNNGVFAGISFSDKELEELRIAAWLHDIGKITTPEHIVDKAAKLEIICDRIELVQERFDCAIRGVELELLRRKLARAQQGNSPAAAVEDEADQELLREMESLRQDKDFLGSCNTPDEFMDDSRLQRLWEISRKTYVKDGQTLPLLTENEFLNLSIRRGTLTAEERQVIERHAVVTSSMLSELPFPKHLKRVPEFAGQHHEKMDGTGYPFRLTGEELSLQARILAVADIFEALTARDRPYKKPMQLSQAIDILGKLKKCGHIDPDVHDLLLESGIIHSYASEELNPDQVDIALDPPVRESTDKLLDKRLTAFLETPPDIPPAQRAKRVLVAVRSVNTAMLLNFYFRNAPFEHDIVDSGLEVLRRMPEGRYDVILLDHELNELDGKETALALRRWEARHGRESCPVLSIAGRHYKEVASQFGETGISSFLSCPLDKDSLLMQIAAFLS